MIKPMLKDRDGGLIVEIERNHRFAEAARFVFGVPMSIGNPAIIKLPIRAYYLALQMFEHFATPYVDVVRDPGLVGSPVDAWVSRWEDWQQLDGFGDRLGRVEKIVRSSPYSVLHLLPSAPIEVVEAAYKALAKLHHPDVGGEVETMQSINSAYREIRSQS